MCIETDRGPWVRALVATGYQVYGVNPKQAARPRELLSLSGAKDDKADARTPADLLRTRRHQLRQVAADSDEATAVRGEGVMADVGDRRLEQQTVGRFLDALAARLPAPGGAPPRRCRRSRLGVAVDGHHVHDRPEVRRARTDCERDRGGRRGYARASPAPGLPGRARHRNQRQDQHRPHERRDPACPRTSRRALHEPPPHFAPGAHRRRRRLSTGRALCRAVRTNAPVARAARRRLWRPGVVLRGRHRAGVPDVRRGAGRRRCRGRWEWAGAGTLRTLRTAESRS
ncbi:IS110 family transposase [Nocardia arthritidis]|uniref:IS110 family transposase n=1 Tax=Nocardia arthritidis TaxID=228602 RepID=UPI000AD819C7|nr:IS110 family transposase [Nocardia arthritidis]